MSRIDVGGRAVGPGRAAEEDETAAGSAEAPAERWIDAHCHLQDAYRRDLGAADELAADAWAAGVVGMVCVGTDVPTSRDALALAGRLGAGSSGRPGVWATAGVHPHQADEGAAALAGLLAEQAGSGALVAVGECGLDYHYDRSPRARQRQVFAEQVALATAHDLALVVHTREAWDDTLDILRAEGPPTRTVLHCFTGGPDEARRSLDLGAHLSFSGVVTFKNAEAVRQAALLCPADRLLVETDAPFLAPVPHRGSPNRPAWVTVVGRALAAFREQDAAELAAITSEVTRQVFRLPAP